MGSSSSKAAKVAAGATKRQYPTRVPPPPSSNASSAPPPPAGQPTAPGPTVHPQMQASETRDESMLGTMSKDSFQTDNCNQPFLSTHQIQISPAPSAPSVPYSPAPPSQTARPSPPILPTLRALNRLRIPHTHSFSRMRHRTLHYWCCRLGSACNKRRKLNSQSPVVRMAVTERSWM